MNHRDAARPHACRRGLFPALHATVLKMRKVRGRYWTTLLGRSAPAPRPSGGERGRLAPERPGGIRNLQIGCGPKHLRSDWWNTDLRPFEGIDEAMDATQPWRWTDLLEHVYAEHFLEHLDLEGAVRFLSYAGRALKIGGHIRLSTPGLEWVLTTHFRLGAASHDLVLDTLRTNRAFHGWGHRFLYSRGMLEWLLAGLGYEDIRFHAYGESERPAFSNIELHGGWSVANDYPSVWIVEASRGSSAIGPSAVMMALMEREFLQQVRGGH
jgi:hypothetical protein